MKKVLFSSFFLTILLVLGACSQSVAQVSNADEVIIRNGNKTYTKQDLFTDMKGYDYTNLVVSSLIRDIAKKEGITAEDIQEDIEKKLVQLKTRYGKKYEETVKTYGGEEIIRENIAASIYQTKLSEKYLTNKLDNYVKEYKPIKAQYAYFDSEETAKSFIEAVKSGADFAQAATEKGYKGNATEKIMTDKDTDLFVQIKSYINSHKETGLSTPISTLATTTDKSGNKVETPRFYVINILDRDYQNFQNDFINFLLTKVPANEILSDYFNQHEVHIYDQRTYDLLAQNFSGIR